VGFFLFVLFFIFQFVVRKMDWMAQKVEGLLEEAQKEAEEAVAEAEVIILWGNGYWGTVI
jgi:phosphotransferase system  glucose/maltose/N-acetylglucosamine-specific IIC component